MTTATEDTRTHPPLDRSERAEAFRSDVRTLLQDLEQAISEYSPDHDTRKRLEHSREVLLSWDSDGWGAGGGWGTTS